MMKKTLQIFITTSFLWSSATAAVAQVVYGYSYMVGGSEIYMVKIDLATCTVCAIKTEIASGGLIEQFTVLPDGTQLHFNGLPGLTVEDVPPSSAVLWSSSTGVLFDDGVLAPNGLVYITSAEDGLYTFDPNTYDIVFVGPWPAGGGCSNLFYQNGQLHGYWHAYAGGNDYDLIVNIADPVNSTFGLANPPYFFCGREITWNGVNGMLFLNTSGSGTLSFYNPVNGTVSTVCAFSPPYDVFVISTDPPAVPEFPCVDPCVTTNAGMYNNIGPYTGCSTVYLPEVPNYDINPTEVINYILYTNPNNPLGSILATSTGSYFFYNPATMQTGINYYAAAIAGNNMGGMVVMTDPCIDVSDSVIVQFKTRPTVSFTAVPAEICPGGCQTITATFTGDPPFSLTGQILSGSTVLSNFSNNFSGNTGTFEVCAPVNVPPGSILIKATSVTDSNCVCN